MTISLTNLEREYLQSVVDNLDEASLPTLRRAFLIAALDGTWPSGGGGGGGGATNAQVAGFINIAGASRTAVDNRVTAGVAGKASGLNGVTGLWQGTQAEYDGLTPDAGVVYVIVPTP